MARLRSSERALARSAELLRARPDEVTEALERKLAELRAAETALRAAEQAALAGTARELAATARDGVVVARRDGLAPERLRDLAGQVRALDGVRTVVLGGTPDGLKVALVAAVAPGATVAAPDLVAEAARLVGGGGGGKNPQLAMAGGRDPARLDEALAAVRARLGR